MLLLNNMDYPLNPYGSYFSSTGFGSDSLLGINGGLNNSSLLGSPSLQSGLYPNSVLSSSLTGTDSFLTGYSASTESVATKQAELENNLKGLTVLKIGDAEHLNKLFFGTSEDPSEEAFSELPEAQQKSYAHIKSVLEGGAELSSLSLADKNTALSKIVSGMKSENPDIAGYFSDRYGALMTAKADGGPQMRLTDFDLKPNGTETQAYETQVSIVARNLSALTREQANLASLQNRSQSNFSSQISPLGYGNSSFNSPYLYNSLGISSLLNGSFNSNSSLSAWTNMQDPWAAQDAWANELSRTSSKDWSSDI